MKSIFKAFFLSLCIIANTHFAFSQTASILPQGYTQYLDANGKPLASGKVYNYIPSTTTFKTTWQDSGETIANTNPVILDGSGRAKILGDGNYRQIVKDRNNNIIWDANTSSTGSGSGGGGTATGDGDLVGTIKPWAGNSAPNQYMFTYGQEISRTTYATLYTAIVPSQPTFCTSGSPTLTGLSDTNSFWIGMSVEVSCLAAGNSTVISKTSSTVTLAANANVTTSATAVFFPWGRGNGTTTFNLPDLRGVVPVGNNIMGGVSSSNLTTTYFGATDPNSTGALGGAQSTTLTAVNIAGHNHPVFLNDPGHTHSISSANTFNSSAQTPGTPGAAIPSPVAATNSGSNTTSITIRDATGTASTTNQTSPAGGGIAVSATVGVAGSGYTNGSQTITVAGGTCTTQPQFTVTISGNAFSGTPSLLTAGSCTVAPTNPAATTGGGGTGGTLNVTYSAQPFSRVQPSKTINFIIKVTPDANSATASGVTSIQSMTGDIACGTGLTCTGNIMSVNTSSIPLVVGGSTITSGTTTRVLYDNAGVLAEYPISGTVAVAMTNSPILVTPTLGVAVGTSLALGGCTIGSNVFCVTGTSTISASLAIAGCTIGANVFCTTGSAAISSTLTSAAHTITSTSSNSLAVGPNGTTNPTFSVDASTASAATGLLVKSAAAAAGLAVSVLSSGTNENLTIDAKGSGTITVAGTSTGLISLNRAVNSTVSLAVAGCTIGANVFCTTGNAAIAGTATVTSASATAFGVGLNGATNPAFNIDASTASSATGLNVKSAAAAGGLAVSVISSGTNENLTINAKGSGTISIGNTSTGNVALAGGGGTVTANGNTVTVNIASGTSALGTSAISSGACATVVTTSATGTATTDVVDFGFNGDPTATTGYVAPNMLSIIAYPSANNVNFKVCNNTASSITPGAITLNWKIRR